MLDFPLDFARPFTANYPEFPDSCPLFDLPFLVEILEMLVDGPDVLLEQLRDERLAQPKRLVDKSAFDPRAAVFRLVQDNLAGREWGVTGQGRLVLRHSEALYRRSARSGAASLLREPATVSSDSNSGVVRSADGKKLKTSRPGRVSAQRATFARLKLCRRPKYTISQIRLCILRWGRRCRVPQRGTPARAGGTACPTARNRYAVLSYFVSGRSNTLPSTSSTRTMRRFRASSFDSGTSNRAATMRSQELCGGTESRIIIVSLNFCPSSGIA